MGRWLLLAAMLAGFSVLSAPPAAAGLCEYPGVGVGANVFVARGAYCDFPTEVNGSHWHCEAGSAGLGGVGVFNGDIGSIGIGGGGVGGASCSFRCPDNTPAPAPNPPGLWKTYLAPHPNACKDHMDAAGWASEPVRPDEGAGPAAPGVLPPGVGPGPDALAPGEPNP